MYPGAEKSGIYMSCHFFSFGQERTTPWKGSLEQVPNGWIFLLRRRVAVCCTSQVSAFMTCHGAVAKPVEANWSSLADFRSTIQQATVSAVVRFVQPKHTETKWKIWTLAATRTKCQAFSDQQLRPGALLPTCESFGCRRQVCNHQLQQANLATTRPGFESDIPNWNFHGFMVLHPSIVRNSTGAGHHSPIGAYDQETDRVLVLDVARSGLQLLLTCRWNIGAKEYLYTCHVMLLEIGCPYGCPLNIIEMGSSGEGRLALSWFLNVLHPQSDTV